MEQGLFVTGTDTEVGKTMVTAGLAAWCKGQERSVGVMKPVASGCSRDATGALVSEDTLFLQQAIESCDPLHEITPITYEAPLSPHMAARRQGPLPETAQVQTRIREAFQSLEGKHEMLLVEGVGGFLVPVTDDLLASDLAGEFGLPVLIVAANRLGVINHTLLTIDAVRARGLTVAGVLLNDLVPPDDAAPSNAEALRLVTDVLVFGPLPMQPDPWDAQAVADALQTSGVTQVFSEEPPL